MIEQKSLLFFVRGSALIRSLLLLSLLLVFFAILIFSAQENTWREVLCPVKETLYGLTCSSELETALGNRTTTAELKTLLFPTLNDHIEQLDIAANPAFARLATNVQNILDRLSVVEHERLPSSYYDSSNSEPTQSQVTDRVIERIVTQPVYYSTTTTKLLTTSQTLTLDEELRLSFLDCSTYAFGGKLTTDENGKVICANDRKSSGGGGSDDQELSFDTVTQQLSIAGGNTVDLSSLSGTSSLSDTDDLTEGITNLYFTNARADARISATTSLPNLTTLANLSTVGTISTGVWNGTVIGDAYLTKTGDWTGTFDGQEGTYYLDLANSTGDTDDLTEGATNLFSQWLESGSDIYYTAGNVGIGDISPASLFTVGNGDLFQVNSAGDIITQSVGVDALESEDFGDFTCNGITCTIDSGVLGTDEIADVYLLNTGDIATGDYDFSTSTLFIDDSASSVGIGTTSPGAKLQVYGNTHIGLGLPYNLGATPSSLSVINSSAGRSYNISSATELFVERNTTAYMSIIGNSSAMLNFGDNSTETRGRLGYITAGDYMVFETEGTEKLRILSDGNVGVGTTSPASKLDVWGDLQVGTSSTPALLVDVSSGNVGIGTTNPSTFKLEVAGNMGPDADDSYNLGAAGRDWGCLYYNTGTLGTCASDERLKEHIQTLSFATSGASALDQVAALTLHTFAFKSAPSSEYKGLIAQEVLSAAPELVTTTTDGYYAVKYGDIQWLVLEAIQELWSTVQDFANNFASKRIVAEDELCVGEVCVTETELEALLNNSGINQSNTNSSQNDIHTEETPTATSSSTTTEETIAGDEQNASTSSSTATTSSATNDSNSTDAETDTADSSTNTDSTTTDTTNDTPATDETSSTKETETTPTESSPTDTTEPSETPVT